MNNRDSISDFLFSAHAQGHAHRDEQDMPGTAIDPVCGMTVAAADSSLQLEHNGVTMYFCSPGCRAAFRKDPERYALTL